MITGQTTPGVNVHTNTAPVTRAAQLQASSKFMPVINSLWGPVHVPTTTSSFADSVRQFGPLDPNSRGMDALYAYFNVFQGYLAQVVRVKGPAAALASHTFTDRGLGIAHEDTL